MLPKSFHWITNLKDPQRSDLAALPNSNHPHPLKKGLNILEKIIKSFGNSPTLKKIYLKSLFANTSQNCSLAVLTFNLNTVLNCRWFIMALLNVYQRSDWLTGWVWMFPEWVSINTFLAIFSHSSWGWGMLENGSDKQQWAWQELIEKAKGHNLYICPTLVMRNWETNMGLCTSIQLHIHTYIVHLHWQHRCLLLKQFAAKPRWPRDEQLVWNSLICWCALKQDSQSLANFKNSCFY